MNQPPAIDLTRDEWELVEEHAAEAKLTLHEYVRRRLTSRPIESYVRDLTAGDEEGRGRFLRISARPSVHEPDRRDMVALLCEPDERGKDAVVACDKHADLTDALSMIMSDVSLARELAAHAEDGAAPPALANGHDQVVDKGVAQ